MVRRGINFLLWVLCGRHRITPEENASVRRFVKKEDRPTFSLPRIFREFFPALTPLTPPSNATHPHRNWLDRSWTASPLLQIRKGSSLSNSFVKAHPAPDSFSGRVWAWPNQTTQTLRCVVLAPASAKETVLTNQN